MRDEVAEEKISASYKQKLTLEVNMKEIVTMRAVFN